MRTHTWRWLKRRVPRRGDERGAEMVEFAIVVVLLITLLYGIVTYGLILAAQATVTQAAADAARSGIVMPFVSTTDTGEQTAAQSQAQTDVGWMDKGSCAGNTNTTAANPISCVATKERCPSNTSLWCLSVTISYSYNLAPLFPELPGLSVITPSTISSTNVLQIPASG